MAILFFFEILAVGKPLLPSQKALIFKYTGTIRLMENYASGEGKFALGGLSRDFYVQCNHVSSYSLNGEFRPTYGAIGPLLQFKMNCTEGIWHLVPDDNSEITFGEISLEQTLVADDV